MASGQCEYECCLGDCVIKLRDNPQKRRDKVYVGCGAGFAGDRPIAALKLLERVENLNYLVLECLAERTLADRFQILSRGGCGYDPRITEWMEMLLPLAIERNVCVITNMGAVDPLGAQEKVLQAASRLGFNATVALVQEVPSNDKDALCGSSTYLGAAPIVECLERYHPNIVITSRVADAALFLAPMVYELGWNWNELNKVAQGTLAGHLLECGCQLTGGYFMHPSDQFRDLPLPNLVDLSLPYAEVTFEGHVSVAKADPSGGVLNFSTCAQQLLYEVGDPRSYITPDVILDITDVSFNSLSNHKVQCFGAKPSTNSVPAKLLRLVPQRCGWKAWGEISYGGYDCFNRAKAAEFLVREWVQEVSPDTRDEIVSYIVGYDSLKTNTRCSSSIEDLRLRMDGLFQTEEHAVQFTHQFTALYTNGPAGGGGISAGVKSEISLEKQLVEREEVMWRIGAKSCVSERLPEKHVRTKAKRNGPEYSEIPARAAPAGEKIPVLRVAHCRAGDKGNTVNFSLIPHFVADIERLKAVISEDWVKKTISPLLDTSSFMSSEAVIERDEWVRKHVHVDIYEVPGVSSLNVVVHNILDGGVNSSRRIDRHGKTISDLVLRQQIMLP